MRINTMPVTSYEVRWFLEGSVAQQDEVKHWFQAVDPWPKQTASAIARPEWHGTGATADVYLVIPGAGDMGIKWRDGTLQLKGRTSPGSTHVFCGRFQGRVERWIKWSYDDLSAFYRHVFAAPPRGVVTVAVRKDRALRKVRLDISGQVEEVAPETRIDRGMTMELTDLEVNGTTFCSLAFEAFPDDSSMPDTFILAVDACLNSLQHVTLAASNSQSYPAWLVTLSGCNARPVAPAAGDRRLTAGAAR